MRCKRVLTIGRHPTFVGRDMVARNAVNGGCVAFVVGDVDAAVALINVRQNSLLVLCVVPQMRGRGLGAETVRFLKPNWVRALESAVPWFEQQGYRKVGGWKQGRSLRTHVMVRESLLSLGGRLRGRLAENRSATDQELHGPTEGQAGARHAAPTRTRDARGGRANERGRSAARGARR